MAESQFCLEWDSHNKNICNGLSSLQQNGEFVDMTLAADGHHVKVHQMVMALASPYIKDLITSANCPHPVIFLNRVSYKTLCSILEYIYTGQALVAVDEISDLILAAKQLHIKGLEDVKTTSAESEIVHDVESQQTELPEIQIKLQRSETASPQISKLSTLKRKLEASNVRSLSSMPLRKRTMTILNRSNDNKDTSELNTTEEKVDTTDFGFDDPLDDRDNFDDDDDGDDAADDKTVAVSKPSSDSPQRKGNAIQYTVSNQGSVQMILNRFIYFLRYTYPDGSQQWCCTNYTKKKCPAKAFLTKTGVVTRRKGSHNHPYHDKRIMGKLAAGAVFSKRPAAEHIPATARKPAPAATPEPVVATATEPALAPAPEPALATAPEPALAPAPIPARMSALFNKKVKKPRGARLPTLKPAPAPASGSLPLLD